MTQSSRAVPETGVDSGVASASFRPEPTKVAKRLTKAQRGTVRDMFGGRCAYCGGMLGERWHADHVEPVLRQDWIGKPAVAPENHRFDNYMPACAPCNISKGRMTIEVWRAWLLGHVRSLNQHHSIYRMVKSFGLVAETGDPVIFHFEAVQGSGRKLADANSNQSTQNIGKNVSEDGQPVSGSREQRGNEEG